MAWTLLKTRTMPIGIDLGTATAKLVQLRKSDDKIGLAVATAIEIPESCQADPGLRMSFVAERLQKLIKSHSFKSRKCAISLPAAATAIEHIKIAKMPPAELDKALRWELDGKLPFDASDAIIRHVVAGETHHDNETGLEVVVIAASRESIESYLEIARRCKLEVEALNVEPCAILECFARLFRRTGDTERVTMYLDFGQTCTQVVVAHGGNLAFAHNLMQGAHHIELATGAALNVSAADIHAARLRLQNAPGPSPEADQLYEAMGESIETLVTEIVKCMRYYESVFPSAMIERAVFLGGQANDRRLCQRVAQRLNLPAQIGDPLARIGGTGRSGNGTGIDRRQAQPAWAVAVGLSLGGDAVQAA